VVDDVFLFFFKDLQWKLNSRPSTAQMTGLRLVNLACQGRQTQRLSIMKQFIFSLFVFPILFSPRKRKNASSVKDRFTSSPISKAMLKMVNILPSVTTANTFHCLNNDSSFSHAPCKQR
jgi:hypothetical protein